MGIGLCKYHITKGETPSAIIEPNETYLEIYAYIWHVFINMHAFIYLLYFIDISHVANMNFYS